MSTKDDGGPAFPSSTRDPWHKGISIRDYFAAHAPAEPQQWFQPAMDSERPKCPLEPKWGAVEMKEWRYFLECGPDVDDLQPAAVREHAAMYEAARLARAAWDVQHAKERYVQWPYAWADAMLKERAK